MMMYKNLQEPSWEQMDKQKRMYVWMDGLEGMWMGYWYVQLKQQSYVHQFRKKLWLCLIMLISIIAVTTSARVTQEGLHRLPKSKNYHKQHYVTSWE